MIKKLRVTVDGIAYDVLVELADEAGAPVVYVPPTAPPPPAPLSLGTVSSAPTESAAPAESAAGPAGPGDVPSPLAGRVTAINVQPGQEVKEGDHLITLEAMKMNTFVMAPRAGKINELKVAVGTAVEEGQVLVTLA